MAVVCFLIPVVILQTWWSVLFGLVAAAVTELKFRTSREYARESGRWRPWL